MSLAKLPSTYKPGKEGWQNCPEVKIAVSDLKICLHRISAPVSDPSIRKALLNLSRNQTIHLILVNKGGDLANGRVR